MQHPAVDGELGRHQLAKTYRPCVSTSLVVPYLQADGRGGVGRRPFCSGESLSDAAASMPGRGGGLAPDRDGGLLGDPAPVSKQLTTTTTALDHARAANSEREMGMN